MQHFFSAHSIIATPQVKQTFSVSNKPTGYVYHKPSRSGFISTIVDSIVDSIVDAGKAVWNEVRVWRQGRGDQHRLARFDDYMLRDIGLNRDQVNSRTGRSYWD